MGTRPLPTRVDLNDLGLITEGVGSVQNGIVARAGGGQSLATPLTATMNRVITVATAADSVLLPVARAGAFVVVVNSAAASMNVFPTTGGVINALSANAAFAMAANKTAYFFCVVDGIWNSILTA
jgi:hypothetical protein